MTKVTRFADRDPGPTARISGFMEHLRENGFRLGVSEAETSLRALSYINCVDVKQTRLALKSVCTGCADDVARFDELFDSFWMNNGRVRQKVVQSTRQPMPQHTRSSRTDTDTKSMAAGNTHAPDDNGEDGDTASQGSGKLVASSVNNLMKKDLRELVSPEDIRQAQEVAMRIGRAIRDRRSRRRKAGRKGQTIDFRRTIRQSLATGGEPLHLALRHRPDRPVKIVALCDVSGSMMNYSRPFLAFLTGLMRTDSSADAYLFHTRLVRITEPLRDDDALRALNRITLLADGFGGGSKIGANLEQFTRSYARKFVDGRSVVIILSDGYDSDPPEILSAALARLGKRGCRIIWLNPLKGWAGYEPVARGMAAALPHLDLFSAANTLSDLAALEPELARL